jgi:hypothetical protein
VHIAAVWSTLASLPSLPSLPPAPLGAPPMFDLHAGEKTNATAIAITPDTRAAMLSIWFNAPS